MNQIPRYPPLALRPGKVSEEDFDDMTAVLQEHGDLVVNKSAEAIVWLKVTMPLAEGADSSVPVEDRPYEPFPVDTRFMSAEVQDGVVDLEYGFFNYDAVSIIGLRGDVTDVKTPQVFGRLEDAEGPDWQLVLGQSSFLSFEDRLTDFFLILTAVGLPSPPPLDLITRVTAHIRAQHPDIDDRIDRIDAYTGFKNWINPTFLQNCVTVLTADEKVAVYDAFSADVDPWYDDLVFQWSTVSAEGQDGDMEWLNGVIKVTVELSAEEIAVRRASRVPSHLAMLARGITRDTKQDGWSTRGTVRGVRMFFNMPMNTAMRLRILKKRGEKRERG